MEVVRMKKFCVVLLFSFIILVFTGCSKEPYTFKQAIETYGDEFQVVELSKSDFLIVWDNAKLIFNNNECISYVSLY